MLLLNVCLSLLVLLLSRSVHGQSGSQLRDTLLALKAQSTLDQSPLLPWHIRIHFDRAPSPGLLQEAGTLDMYWLSPTESRTVLTTSSTTAIRIRKDDQISTSRASIPAVDLELLNLFISPLSSLGPVEKTSLRPSTEIYAATPLNCITADDASPGRVTVHYTVVCPTADTKGIRLIQRWANQTILISRLGSFQGKSLPVDLQIANGNKLFVQAHLEQLSTFQATDLPALPDQLTPSQSVCDHVKDQVHGQVSINPNSITHNQPSSLKAPQSSASARLHVVVGKDGHAQSVEVLQATDYAWAATTIDAVRRELFLPAKAMDGAAIACSIDMQFNAFRN